MEARLDLIEVRVHTLSESLGGEPHFLAHNLSQLAQEFVVFHCC